MEEEKIRKIAESLIKLGMVNSEKDAFVKAREIAETEKKVSTPADIKLPADKLLKELMEEDGNSKKE